MNANLRGLRLMKVLSQYAKAILYSHVQYTFENFIKSANFISFYCRLIPYVSPLCFTVLIYSV